MKEILFRGKRVDNGEWVCSGNLIHFNKVIHKTVGQYTGLCDKNGKKIFEGDIVKTKFGRLCHVKWRITGCFCGFDLIPIEAKSRAPKTWDLFYSENLEVVGNVHDNPELVEQEG